MADIREMTGKVTAAAQTAAELRALLEPIGTCTWRGGSGRDYPHVCYTLIGCPIFAAGTYLLVKVLPDGRRLVLGAGRTESPHPTLNRAQMRKHGATVGAGEVHVMAHSGSDAELALAVFDLSIAHVPQHGAVGAIR